MASAPSHATHSRRSMLAAARAEASREVATEIARYLGAVSILLVGVVHAQQYYDAYFSVVPTIGTLFLLSFIGAGVVGAVLIAPVRRLGRQHRRPDPRRWPRSARSASRSDRSSAC